MGDVRAGHITRHESGIRIVRANGWVKHRPAPAGTNYLEAARPLAPAEGIRDDCGSADHHKEEILRRPLDEHAQNGRGAGGSAHNATGRLCAWRAARRAAEFLFRLVARIRVLCASQKHLFFASLSITFSFILHQSQASV